MVRAKNYKAASTFVKLVQIKLLASFFWTRCKRINWEIRLSLEAKLLNRSPRNMGQVTTSATIP